MPRREIRKRYYALTEMMIYLLQNIHTGITLSNLSRKCWLTYSHVCVVVPELTKLGLTTRTDYDGRSKLIQLTPRGYEVVKRLNQIEEICKEMEDKND